MIAYNKMHADYCVKVRWDVGGLKRKFKRPMKQFDATRPKYNLLFKVVTILTNFVHRHRMDFHHDVVGELVDPIQGHGWDAND